jgi:hypothetical protein
MSVFEARRTFVLAGDLILTCNGWAIVLGFFDEFLKLFTKQQQFRVALREGLNSTVWRLPIRAAKLAMNLISKIFRHRQWIARPQKCST